MSRHSDAESVKRCDATSFKATKYTAHSMTIGSRANGIKVRKKESQMKLFSSSNTHNSLISLLIIYTIGK